MGNQIPLSHIEDLFNRFLHPYRCQCRLLNDASLIINVQDGDLQDNYLTVAGVPLEQCRDEQQLRRLARSLIEELSALREPAVPAPGLAAPMSQWSFAR